MAKTEKQEVTAWNGKKIIFYPNSHRYMLDKQILLSPSSVVGIIDKSTPLLIWNDNLIKEDVYSQTKEEFTLEEHRVDVLRLIDLRNVKVKEAQDIGTSIHNYVEEVAWSKTNNLELPAIPEGINEKVIEAFISLDMQYNLEFDDSEHFIFSESYGIPYAGRLDARIKLNGKAMLVDWKSSKAIYFTHKVQLAGYDLALEEEYGGRENLPYEELAIIHLDKFTGEFTIHTLTEEEREECRTAFKLALQLKTLVKKNDKYKD